MTTAGRRRSRVRRGLVRARLLRTRQHDVIGGFWFLDLRSVLYLKGREFAVVIYPYPSLCIEQMDKRNRLAPPPWLELLESRHPPGQDTEDEREPKKTQQRP